MAVLVVVDSYSVKGLLKEQERSGKTEHQDGLRGEDAENDALDACGDHQL